MVAKGVCTHDELRTTLLQLTARTARTMADRPSDQCARGIR